MKVVSEYTLAFRVESEAFRVESLVEMGQMPGELRRISRKRTRMHEADAFDQWEMRAEESGSMAFDSISSAFSRFEEAFVVGEGLIKAMSEGYDAYWWCGCFHSVSPSLTVVSQSVLLFVGGAGARLILDTYYSPEEQHLEVDSAGEETDRNAGESRRQEGETHGHHYRFRFLYETVGILDTSDRAGGELWSAISDDFSSGLALFLANNLDSRHVGVDEDVARPVSILCEHTQYSFDGGPCITSDQCGAVAERGLSLSILWRAG